MTAFFLQQSAPAEQNQQQRRKSDAPNCQYQKSPWVSAHGDPRQIDTEQPCHKTKRQKDGRGNGKGVRAFVQLAILYSGDLIVQDVVWVSPKLDITDKVIKALSEPQAAK